MPGLERFVEAQRGVYPQALEELRRGSKTSHWMWFVFPQIAGLGRSATARHFAIRDLDEARAYLAHDQLGPRLREATAVVAGWAGRRTLEQIFGAVDALKFVSSITLFEAAADPAEAVDFARALDSLAQGARDRHTLDLIAA
jgi:uncharacterized protein (DUF1810 family)